MFINRGSWHILVHVVGSKLRDTEDYDDNDDGDAGSYPIIKSFMAHITSQFPAWIGLWGTKAVKPYSSNACSTANSEQTINREGPARFVAFRGREEDY